MRGYFCSCLVVLVGLSGACAGRSIRSGTDDGTGGTDMGSGATTTTGGTGHAGTGSSRAGNGSGGTLGKAGTGFGGSVAVAGTTSTGGAACVCDTAPCIMPGFLPVPDPGGCCYHCECEPRACPGVACAFGSHLEVKAGQCCPVCVQDDCAKQRDSYLDFKRQLLEKYQYGCTTDAECTLFYDKSPCSVGCGAPVWTGALGNLQSNLESYSQQNCSDRCQAPVPPCDAPAAPTCLSGRCL
jgi:hypothetical protein